MSDQVQDPRVQDNFSISSLKTSKLYQKFLKVIIPQEFYYVREEITPKASPNILQMMSFLIYSLCIMTFCMIFFQQLKITFKENKIVNEDISNHEWECQMISKVTSKYTVDIYEKFDLVNECSQQKNVQHL